MNYKLTNQFYIKGLCLLLYFAAIHSAFAQDTTVLNKYSLWVINNKCVYKKNISTNPEMTLQDVKKIIPAIELDLRYATTNNFIHKRIYQNVTTTYLCMKAITALSEVQQKLIEKGLGLKIFDAYRPYAATELMWELVKDDRYTADPKKGSGHNRGIAVDLTIIDFNTKKEIAMGTAFDNFSDTAHHNFTALSNEILQNRLLLKELMEHNGFKALDTEWWHYSLTSGKKYPLLNLSFKTLKKMQKK